MSLRKKLIFGVYTILMFGVLDVDARRPRLTELEVSFCELHHLATFSSPDITFVSALCQVNGLWANLWILPVASIPRSDRSPKIWSGGDTIISMSPLNFVHMVGLLRYNATIVFSPKSEAPTINQVDPGYSSALWLWVWPQTLPWIDVSPPYTIEAVESVEVMAHRWVTSADPIKYVKNPGRLKMQDRKMTDRKMTDKSARLENAGLENDGLENDGQKCTVRICYRQQI